MRISLLGLVLLFSTIATAQSGPVQIIYGVEVKPDSPLSYQFTIDVQNPERASEGGKVAFVFPYWAPGAYRAMTTGVRSGEFAIDGFDGFKAVDESGRELAIQRPNPRRFEVEVKGIRRIRFSYRNPNAGTRHNNRSFLDSDCGIIDGPRSFAYLDGAKSEPCHVHFRLPDGWKVGTGLDPTFDPMVFHADDFDWLVDCPTAVGLFEEKTFHVRGVPHRIVALTGGKPITFKWERFLPPVEKIVETYIAIFDDVPYQHYTFIYTNGGGGGLEHLTSTTISAGPATSLSPARDMPVTAHELFHAWNVKRLRPLLLGPFDYTAPVKVKDLWICEGITSYYTTLGLWRSGHFDEKEFLKSYEVNIQAFQRNPAHLIISPEEASLSVWERDLPYNMDYYLQGEVLGLMIDLLIRDRSDNTRSFDDVMRALYRKYGGYYRHQPPMPGYQSDDVLRVANEVTGVDLSEFWNSHVRSAEDVDWNRYLRAAGLEIERQEREVPAVGTFRRGERADGGILLRIEAGDALDNAGFKNGDILKALDGKPITTPRGAVAAFNGLKPGIKSKAELAREGAALTHEFDVLPISELTSIGLRDTENDGVRVTGVPHGTAVMQAGLRRGDVLLEIDGAKAATVEDSRSRFAAAGIQSEVRLRILRDGKPLELVVPGRPRRMVDVGALRSIPDSSPRALAIREGLRTGTAQGVPK